jgi:exonuclease III
VATFNGSGWGTILDFARHAQPDIHVICGQEHRKLPQDIMQCSTSAAKAGWKSFWAPANKTDKSTSAGVVILVRKHMATWNFQEDAQICPGRVVWCVVRLRTLGDIAIYSSYFKVGVGIDDYNTGLIKAIGLHTKSHGMPYIVAGDFNINPADMQSSELWNGLQGRIKAPEAPTCYGPTGNSPIDYHISEARLARCFPEFCGA